LKKAWFSVLLAVLAGTVVEGGAWAITRMLVARAWMAEIPHFSNARIEKALAQRDPLLGWAPGGRGAVGAGAPRPRPDPAFPDNAPPCVSAYGDSFTVGGAPEATYPHFLGVALGCRAANFGAPGYGSDQALMLFRRRRPVEHAPVCILGHLSENILRNVNRFRNLLYPGPEMVFKPRFVEKRGRLVYLPMPVNSVADYRAFEDDPQRGLAFDAFAARPRRAFPYSVALARWFLKDFRVRAKILGRPSHEEFYRPGHPSGALRLTTTILTAFAEEAHRNGQHPLVILIPTGPDLLYARRTGRWTDQPLRDALDDRGVPVVQAGPAILRRLGEADPCGLFANCNGHFNARGYQVLAHVVADAMRRLGLIGILHGGNGARAASAAPRAAEP